MWVYNERKEEKATAKRSTGTGTSHLGKKELYNAMFHQNRDRQTAGQLKSRVMVMTRVGDRFKLEPPKPGLT